VTFEKSSFCFAILCCVVNERGGAKKGPEDSLKECIRERDYRNKGGIREGRN
jgi:hypothetical protein